MLDKYNYILWDFDGVIINSDKVRVEGFVQTLKHFPQNQLDLLLAFHSKNGGLSRYVKFRYFFEKIRKEEVDEQTILEYAKIFSSIMKSLLIDRNLLINQTMEFIQRNYKKFAMHIVSGSDENELRFLCKALEIDHYFKSISGSPTPKNDLVKYLIDNDIVIASESFLIGDSINDFEAAEINHLDFMGFNNLSLLLNGVKYITAFDNIK